MKWDDEMNLHFICFLWIIFYYLHGIEFGEKGWPTFCAILSFHFAVGPSLLDNKSGSLLPIKQYILKVGVWRIGCRYRIPHCWCPLRMTHSIPWCTKASPHITFHPEAPNLSNDALIRLQFFDSDPGCQICSFVHCPVVVETNSGQRRDRLERFFSNFDSFPPITVSTHVPIFAALNFTKLTVL